MRVEHNLEIFDDFRVPRRSRRDGRPVYEILHLHEKAVDKKGVFRREVKVGVRRVIVNGEARDADRHDALVPRSSASSKRVAADPFYRQILAAHRLDEIADSQILNRCLAARCQDARTFEHAVTATAIVAATVTTAVAAATPSSSVSGFRTRRQRCGCERCNTYHFGGERGGRAYEVAACWAKRAIIGSRHGGGPWVTTLQLQLESEPNQSDTNRRGVNM